ncbi:MAG: MarR family transcriptional regulator, partial [Methanoregula sp.]|nr:MarR family transcriptional regulator [Methanoregula sp.]
GIDAPTVNASLDRLIRYLLIEHSGGKFRALSIPEALLKCQIKNSCDSEFTIVDGVIKVRKP